MGYYRSCKRNWFFKLSKGAALPVELDVPEKKIRKGFERNPGRRNEIGLLQLKLPNIRSIIKLNYLFIEVLEHAW